MKQIESILEKHLNKNLLRHAAGTALFCPTCDTILDCRRTVLVSIHRTLGDKPEECVWTYTSCSSCWDTRKEAVTRGAEISFARHPELHGRLKVVDGREVFKR